MQYEWKISLLKGLSRVIAWIAILALIVLIAAAVVVAAPLLVILVVILLVLFGAGAIREFAYDLSRKLRQRDARHSWK